MPEADTTKPTRQKLCYEHVPQAAPSTTGACVPVDGGLPDATPR